MPREGEFLPTFRVLSGFLFVLVLKVKGLPAVEQVRDHRQLLHHRVEEDAGVAFAQAFCDHLLCQQLRKLCALFVQGLDGMTTLKLAKESLCFQL